MKQMAREQSTGLPERWKMDGAGDLCIDGGMGWMEEITGRSTREVTGPDSPFWPCLYHNCLVLIIYILLHHHDNYSFLNWPDPATFATTQRRR